MQDVFDEGLEIRRKVMGENRVESAFAQADNFTRDFQELLTTYCWGAVWGREGLSPKTRSMLNIAMLAALGRPNELKLHVQGALRNGVTTEEIREILIQVMVYAGAPAGVDGFRIAREAIAEFEQDE